MPIPSSIAARNCLLTEVLRQRAAEHPERLGFSFLDGSGAEVETLTRGELDFRARTVAAALQQAGAAGERALLLHPPGLGFVASFLGCLQAGTVAVPAYPPGRNRPPARLRAIAADAGARVVLAPSSLASDPEALVAKVPELGRALWIATDALPPELAHAWRETSPAPDDPAFLQYTSGSTADPKGVVVTHGNLLHNEEAIRDSFGMSVSSVVVGWLPLYHDMGLIGNVLQPLYTGARAVLLAPLSFLQRPALWLETIFRYRSTTSGGPNFAYDLCVRKVGEAEKAGLDLSSWTVAFNGAEPVRAETIERFAAAFASCGFRREAFFPCYGLAEATLLVSGGALAAAPESGDAVSCGRAAAGQTVVVVEPEACTPCPPGAVGEIWVAGPSVAAGYWGRPEETARTFGARLASGEGPFLRTGDLGFLADGELFVTGRLKDLIILRGRNHYPQDLEWTAEASHPALRPGCAAAFSVDREGEERLVLLCEVERSAADPAGIAEAVRRAVAEEHEITVEEVVLLRAGTILKTSSGKIRRAACRAAWLAGELAVVARSRAVPELPAEGRGEDLGAALRAEAGRALRRETAGIDPDVPLTALGLDSLAAAELRSAVEDRLGVAVPLPALLEGISLRGLEAEVRAATPSKALISLPAGLDAPGEHPLSEGQRALWFLDRLNPAAAACNLAGAARVPQGIDLEALRRALTLLAERHSALRTTFEARGGEPVRRIHPFLEPDLREGSLEDAYLPFDLERGPLLRVRVWSLPEGGAALLMAVHHLIVDFASVAVLLRDLAALYRQERGGAPARLSPPGVGYTAWLRRREEELAGEEGERLRSWWHERLAGDLPALDLPGDRPPPVTRSWRGVVRTLRLPGAAAGLRSVARSRGVTLYAALLAGFQTVLQRWTGQGEMLVGAPAASRAAGLDNEVGYFVNPVPLRLDLAGELSFVELAARAGAVAVEAFAHGDYPFPRLARELRLDRDAGRSLVRAMLVLQPGRSPEERALAPFALGKDGARADFGGLALEAEALPEIRTQLDCMLMAAEVEDEGLELSLQLDADLFDAVTADRLVGHLGRFLRKAAAEPGRPAAAVEILSEAERVQIGAWSAGPPLEQDGHCLHELIAEQAARTPDNAALVHGEERLTYRELWNRASQLADHLRGLGVGPEVRVGVCAGRSTGMVAGLLAVLEAGGTYVPLDPAYPEERLAYLVEDSGAALLLTDGTAGERLRADLPRMRLDEITVRGGPVPFPGRPLPENLAYLIYTSGSTGQPKAVAIPHRSAAALARWARDAFSARELDGVLAATSIGFDLSVFELLVPLCWGGRVVLAGSILDLPEIPASAGVRLVNTVPSALAELLRAGRLPASVETVNLAGEPLRRDLVRALFAAGVGRVVNLYGPSEDTTYSTVADQERDGEGEPPIGRPVAGTRARVLDAALRPVPPGVAGELFLGGAGLARGYLGRPDLTAERFVPSPFAGDGPGARLYRTGDRVRYRADGELVFLGRLDHQVKIRGFRIEPGEVEAALLRHPDVEQAVVLALGEGGERRLVAYVAPPPAADLRQFLAERLPEHMVPSGFVVLKVLPLTPNGKVDRNALASLAPGPAVRPAHEPPRSPLEAAVAAVWGEVLGIDQVGVHDDFFHLGGHSLLAVRVQSRVRERLGVDLPLAAVFRAPTVAGLARVAAEAPVWSLPPPGLRPRDGSPFPLSFAQERMWLLHRLDPGSPAYNVAGEVRLAGPLKVPALAGAVRDLARCHEVLRTRFPEGEGGPVQVVDPAARLDMPVVSLELLPAELREAEAERLAREAARRPFDLATAPPARAALLRLTEDEHRLLLAFHHVAVDEASLEILARDLGDSLSRGPLTPPPLQIADVALWERERLRGEALEARLAWWEERLSGLSPLDLPASSGDRGGAVSAPLPAETAELLSALARQTGATLFMVNHAGFQAFLSRLFGAVDFAVGSPFAVRGHRALEGVVGPLLNTLVLRADLAGDPSFRELLGRVREGTIAAHERADLPFELLVEHLRPERDPGANPLFQVMFVLHRPPAPFHSAGLAIEPRSVPTGTAKLALTLYALERAEGIELELEYAIGLWDRATAARLLEDLANLLAGVAADPGLRFSELPVLGRSGIVARTPERRLTGPGGVAPRSPLEQLLAGIWEDLLELERPDLHDDFFALGGHSLLAARVVSRLRAALGVELPLRTLFEARTLAGLANRVEVARAEGGRVTEPPLVPVPREGGLPLSFGQERLWFLDRLDPGSPVYNMPAAVRLDGLLEPERLRAALDGIAARHEVLRTGFPAPQGTPVQVAAPRLGLGLPQVDLSGLPGQAAGAEALRLAAAEGLRPFDLETGPPLRASLLRLDDEEHVLLITVHHIAFDGWSQGIFLRELAALYGGEPLPALPVQYADFAVWQRRCLEGGDLAGSLAWWRERLAGAPPVLPLPLDRPRPPLQTFRGGSVRLELRPETVRAVRDLGRRLEATPFMTLLAVWAALLARFTAETDLVVGTAVAGRDRPELEPLIGLFAGNLALRLDLAGDPAFADVVARARETTLSAWAHREVPFERLVRELRPERDLSHTPLYQAVLTLDASDRPPLELSGLRLEELAMESGTARYDLALYLEDRRGRVAGLLEYNRLLFDPATAARLLAAFLRLTEAASRDPERRVSELPVLSAAERHQLLVALSGAPAPPAPLVPRLVRAEDRPAVTAGGRTLSYAELDLQAGGLAGRLRALGVGPEVRVAVCLDRSPELIVALLGIWKAGGVYVPLDPTHPEERLAWMVEDSGAAAVLASRRGPAPPVGAPAVLFLEDVSPGDAPPAPLLLENAAYLLYTSGSTGRPKGVVVSHGALAAYAAAVAGLYGIGPGDRILQNAALGFDLSLDEIVPCLAGGAELVMRDDAMLASAAAFLQGCREREITVMSLPTALWHEIAARLEGEDLALPPELRLVILGGERLLPERLAAWQQRFPAGPRLLNTYGPTEATIIVTATDVTAPESSGRGEAPLGRPLTGVGIWLLGRNGEPVPPGVPGEVCIGGSFLARGYAGLPDRTAERFVPHPFSSEPGARLYRTGDLARWLPDGALEFAGRVDSQVKVRGYRVEPGEGQAALARHPGVAGAAVTVWGEGQDKRLVGYVVPRPPAPSPAEVRAFLAASLPEPLVPSELVFLEELPLNVHGKVDRKALPPPTGETSRAGHVPPRDERERAVAALWSEALGVERLGIHDNYFDLGGHSLVLARVHVLLRERLGREIPIVDLFRHPTVASLARRLAEGETGAPPPVPLEVQVRAERGRARAAA
ncbi:MAG TPA: amino acid adenylation domain-containing protein, partial [Thermoanaerobaculia bacterium]|nr:amino acid adenylation domain-containing protein [Thermoanaerobaculia bacterium]